jgi:membrane-bound metal-dependent hydrolase YbcI (DUF457 family)
MPSPLGHLIAGASVALAAEPRREAAARWPRLLLVCAFLAAAPDLDLLYPGGHRVLTHSLLSVGLVGLAAAAVTRYRTSRIDWRVAAACSAAWATHLVTDYFGVDVSHTAGIQLLWPWSDAAFKSDWSLFLATERNYPLSPFGLTSNLLAAAREILVLGPILLLFLLRRRRLSGASAAAPASPNRRGERVAASD